MGEGTRGTDARALALRVPLLGAVASSLDVLISYWDTDLRCRFANGAYAQWFGVSEEWVIGKHASELLGPEIYGLNRPLMEAALGGEPQSFERESRLRGTGDLRYSLGRYLPDVREGAVVGFTTLVMDVTDRRRAELELARHEHELREACRMAGMGSWEWDPATNETRWSDELFRLFDRDPAQGPPSYDELATCSTEPGAASLHALVTRALATGEPYEIETSFERRDGTTTWLYGKGEAVRAPHENNVKLRGTVIDVTARKTTELALRRREDALREAERIARMGSWSYTFHPPAVWWSPSCHALLGWPHDQPAPDFPDHGPFYTPESWTRLQAAVASAIATETPYDLELELTQRRTDVRWIRARGEPMKNAHGVLVGLRGIILDITDQRASQAALRDSEARYALIAESTLDVIWLYDLERASFDFVSPSIRRLAGYAVDEARALTLSAFVDAETVARVRGGTSDGVTTETTMRHRDGHALPVEVVVTPVRGDGGRTTHLQGVTRDVSARRRLEEQVCHLQKMESVGRLAGGVAHDFNNLLTVILGQIEFVKSTLPETSEQAEALDEALRAAKRSAELTHQLLAFARRQPVSPRSLDLNVQIEDALSMLRRLVGETIEVVWTPGSTWRTKLDPSQVHQLLANLVVNARDAIGGSGRVTIATSNVIFDDAFCRAHPGSHPGDHVLITVSDTGHGMTPDVRARVFEPFFTTKGPATGTGLGLSIVYGIATQNAGGIAVESEPGAGTTFQLWFPRCDGEPASAETKLTVPRGTETVLVVEDERAVLELTRNMLQRLGYVVRTANTPSAALAEFGAEGAGIDLVVSDMVMPEMNGTDLVHAMRRRKPDQPFLFMSGYPVEPLVTAPPILVQKPFTLPELARAVRQALE